MSCIISKIENTAVILLFTTDGRRELYYYCIQGKRDLRGKIPQVLSYFSLACEKKIYDEDQSSEIVFLGHKISEFPALFRSKEILPG